MLTQSILLIWIVVILYTFRLSFDISVLCVEKVTTASEVAVVLCCAFATWSWVIHCLNTVFKEVLAYVHLMRLVVTAHFRLESGSVLI